MLDDRELSVEVREPYGDRGDPEVGHGQHGRDFCLGGVELAAVKLRDCCADAHLSPGSFAVANALAAGSVIHSADGSQGGCGYGSGTVHSDCVGPGR